MIDLCFRPIDKPVAPPRGGAKRAPFKVGYSSMLDDLERELKHLRAREIIVEAGFDLSDIRNDGWPRSTARTRSPGIRLSFVSSHGPLSYECATYQSWEDNMRGISLTLSALRAVDRYGAVKGGEQYKGWARLPEKAGTETAEAAARELIELAGVAGSTEYVLRSRATATEVRNLAMRAHHPDVNHNAPDAAANTQRVLRAFETIVKVQGPTWARGGAA
jgi:hypothetical protein